MTSPSNSIFSSLPAIAGPPYDQRDRSVQTCPRFNAFVYAIAVTLVASGPFWPSRGSYSTREPSSRDL
jgi:hypothetical protein